MLSIKQKIFKSFFTLVISIPIIILVSFNFIVWIYSYNESKINIEHIAHDIQRNFSGNRRNLSKNNEGDALFDLIRTNNRSDSTELIAFNGSGKLIYPRDISKTFLNENIAQKAYESTKKTFKSTSFSVGTQNFHAIKINIESDSKFRFGSNIDSVIYISAGNISSNFIEVINIILLSVSFVVIILFIIVSKKLSEQISRPLTKLTNSISKIDYNTCITLDTDTSSLEVNALIEKLNEMTTNIYTRTQKQNSFLEKASHDIRTPLMSIIGYAEGIEVGVFNDAKHTSSLINKEAKRLTSLVENLLILSRAENSNINENYSDIELSEYICDIAENYKSYDKSKKIILNVNKKVHLNTNCEMLSSATENILSNAIRYAKSTITIDISRNDKYAIIKISDDGDGIKNIDKIFDKFYKGTNGNFGLGLSIAKTSIESIKGTLIASNDNGAVFKIILPL